MHYLGKLFNVLHEGRTQRRLGFICVHTSFPHFKKLKSQEYREEFREIAGKAVKTKGGGSGVAEANITLINQRHVGDDLPVIMRFFVYSFSF